MNMQIRLLTGRQAALAAPWPDRRKVDRPRATKRPPRKIGQQEKIALGLVAEIKMHRAQTRDGYLHRRIAG